MIYDVALVTVRPGSNAAAIAGMESFLQRAPSHGELLACWHADVGALNQVLVLRAYPDDAAAAADRAAILQSGNPFGIGAFIAGISMDSYVPFPFLAPMQPGQFGPVFEVRTYLLTPAGLAPTIELWRKAVPDRAKASPLLAAMYSISGAVTRFMHIWPYPSLDERARLRAKVVADGVWPPPGGPDHMLAQQSDIYLPVSCSPIR
jgi:hypothetical protein